GRFGKLTAVSDEEQLDEPPNHGSPQQLEPVKPNRDASKQQRADKNLLRVERDKKKFLAFTQVRAVRRFHAGGAGGATGQPGGGGRQKRRVRSGKRPPRRQRKRRHRSRPASSVLASRAVSSPLPLLRARPRRRHALRPRIQPFPSPAALVFTSNTRASQITTCVRLEGGSVGLTWARAGGRPSMGGPTGGRRWARRSCRAGGAGGVVRRTVAAPAPAPAPASGFSTARRRTEGFAHVDKQRRVHGLSSDFRCSTASATQDDSLSRDVGELKHKSAYRNSCLPGAQTNVTGTCHLRPSVMAELHDFDGASGIHVDSMSGPRKNKISTSKELLQARSTVSGLPTQLKYCLTNRSNSAKNPPTGKSCSNTSDFRHQLVRNAERSVSANISLSEKMSLLHRQQDGGNHQSRNRISALNRRHRIVNSRGENDLSSKEKVHGQPEFSLGRYSQALFDNGLVRQNQRCCSEALNQKTFEQLWSSTCSSTSGDSIDDFQISSSSDTSDNSNLSSLGVIAKDQWKMTFKKVYCPLAARLDSTSVTQRKAIGQASPVSVLEPLSEYCSDSENFTPTPADPYDLQLRLELVKFAPIETTGEASSIGGTSDLLSSEMESGNDEPIELVEDILEEFEDEEERDFCYLLDILIASGIHGTAEDQLYKVCQSLDCPAGYDVFEKLEKKYTNVVQWSRSDRRLLFDMVNTILSQILAPCLNMQPWVKNTPRNLAPLWGSEGLLEKVLQVLTQRREELALSQPKKPEKKAFDQNWPDLAGCIDRAGRDIEKMIKDDLLEELLLELLSS
ncbi:hypothetical protein EJB05_03820, partial [Eragrostis curvula]